MLIVHPGRRCLFLTGIDSCSIPGSFLEQLLNIGYAQLRTLLPESQAMLCKLLPVVVIALAIIGFADKLHFLQLLLRALEQILARVCHKLILSLHVLLSQ